MRELSVRFGKIQRWVWKNSRLTFLKPSVDFCGSQPRNFTDSLITVGDGVTAMSSGGTSDDPFTVTVKGVSIATVIA